MKTIIIKFLKLMILMIWILDIFLERIGMPITRANYPDGEDEIEERRQYL